MGSAQTQKALASAGLARVAPELAALAQPSIRLTTTPADEARLATGASKFGGLPDMPIGTAWPILNGVAMSFVGQIRLEDARPYDVRRQLPSSGLLSFFYDARQQTYGDDPKDRGGWWAHYFADTTQLQRTDAPVDLPDNARFKPCALAFSSELTMPLEPHLERADLTLTSVEEKAYETFLSSFPTPQGSRGIRNRMLGYADTIQDDMRLQAQLVSHGLTDSDDPKAKTLLPGAMDWILLLQVDSDPNAGMRWASEGRLYFWIDRAALAATAFDSVWAILQSD
ncbi:MAG TPA: YwqG family protein [Ktedonobacterales bacterium]|jgi:uncharacterized protein YwqG|nr:YwqG family protein [Ktedonobacterales bacterium]